MITSPDNPSSSSPPASRWLRWACIGLIAVIVVAAYANSFEGVFVYDDAKAIQNNTHIRHLWPPSEALSLPLTRTGITVSGRPVLSLSLAVNHALLGNDPWGYHAGNLLIHLCATMLLFGVVRRTLELPVFTTVSSAAAVWIALVAAVLWGVHPLGTSAVTYLSQRAESQAGMFLLLAVYCVIRAASGRRVWLWHLVATLACLLGMGSKESVIAGPLLILLYDRTFLSVSFGLSLRRARWLYTGLAGAWVLDGALILWKQSQLIVKDFGTDWSQYARTQPGVVLHYLRLTFWPDTLTMDYNWAAAEGLVAVVGPGLVLLGILALTVWGLVRRGWWGLVGAWFFLLLAPSSGVAALYPYVQEHRMYLPLAAVIVAVVALGYSVTTRMRRPSLPRWISIAIIAGACACSTTALVWRTHRRNADYASVEAFWAQNLRDRPQSTSARINLAVVRIEEGRLDDGIDYLRQALAIRPHVWLFRTYYRLGVALIQAERYAEAVEPLRKAAELAPNDSDIVANLGFALWTCEPTDETPQEGAHRKARSEAILRRAAQLKARMPTVYKILGTSEAKRGNLSSAEWYLRRSIELDPNDRDMRDNLSHVLLLKGRKLFDTGQIGPAITVWDDARVIFPASADIHNALGVAWAARGDRPRAIRCLQRALQIDPNHSGARENLQRLQAGGG